MIECRLEVDQISFGVTVPAAGIGQLEHAFGILELAQSLNVSPEQ